MPLSSLMPDVHLHLQLSQTGIDILTIGSGRVTGSGHGYGGAGAQYYREFIAGEECRAGSAGEYITSDGNTNGTSFFPELKYWTGFMNNGRVNTAGGIPSDGTIDSDIMAKGYNGESSFARGAPFGLYTPDAAASAYLQPIYGQIIYGKFSRVSLWTDQDATSLHRVILFRGPDNVKYNPPANLIFESLNGGVPISGNQLEI